GKMGSSILSGIIKSSIYNKNEILLFDINENIKTTLLNDGFLFSDNEEQLLENVEMVIIAIKPQMFNVLKQLKFTNSNLVVISIAAGKTISNLKEIFGNNKYIRVMPNTPALVEAGMSGVCFDASEYTEDEKNTVLGILEACGRVKIVTEAMMSAVTCASGSSPAYVYMFIEALADSVVKYGIPRDMAYEMAAQTVLGAAKMVLETGENPAVLKDRVCSPGGTTIAAVAALEEYGFRNAIFKATDKCFARAEELK
ncbi:MAG: pyrroline-5-carboxylate reductase, partial [Lachnospiraceae bacterium]|nr:pyrroline-5-carboxylate reductase [Lachnospiraceae bacterium]